MNRSEIILLSVLTILGIYWVLILLLPEILSPITLTFYAFQDFTLFIGYPGVFLISLIGNATILIPFPYIAVPFFMGVDPFNPWITGILAGFGAIIGEMTGYIAGYFGRELIDSEKAESFSNYIEHHAHSTPIIIWFLAITPIPDDFFIVPLGAARYPWWKVFVPGFIGKTMFLTGIAWAGRLGLNWIEMFFANGDSIISRSVEVIAVILIVIAIFAVTRVDWSTVTERKIIDSN